MHYQLNFLKENLIKQLYAAGVWVDAVRALRAAGVEKAVECGPGKVLAGLIKRIEPEIACFASEDSASIDNAVTETGS